MREVSATCNSDGVAEADGSLMFPEVLRPAPGEGIPSFGQLERKTKKRAADENDAIFSE